MNANLLALQSRRKKFLGLCLMFFIMLSSTAFSQSITSFSPTVISYKSNVRIEGTGFVAGTTVQFGTENATVVSRTSTVLVVTPPAGLTTGNHLVKLNNGTSFGTISYIVPSNTPATARVNRVITDFSGYWNSTGASETPSSQPDTNHNMLAFGFGTKIYTTGVNNTILSNNGVGFEPGGDFRALPIDILGSTSTAGDNYILYGANIDGTLTQALLPNASSVRVKDVLMDGIKGLDLGTGVTNVNTNATFEFDIARIADDKLNDAEPDIIITQIADPGDNTDVYYFTDAAGNVVGNPLYATLKNLTEIGRAKVDLFLLPSSTAYATAEPATTGTSNGTRDIRMIGFKLSEFGITTSNYARITKFKVFPGGTSDMAFTAYNANSIFIPAPAITTQPSIVSICPTGSTGNNVTFSVVASGNGKYYQWKKDGVDIAGATNASYTITNVTNAHVGAYTVEVRNVAGAVLSEPAFLGNYWTGAVSTAWGNTSNWYCGLIPSVELNANIPGGLTNYPVLRTTTRYCKDLNIASGASITIIEAGALEIAGKINKTGTLNVVDGTVRMVGTTGAQTIPANTFETNYIKNLTIRNTAGVTLAGALNLTGVLHPESGTFTTGNQLTLKSNAATTAMIAQVTGTVSGEMTIERYIPSRRAFRFLTSSVNTTGTIHDNWQEKGSDAPGWGTDITGAGAATNGFDASGSNNPSLFRHVHNNSTTGTWAAVTSTNVPMVAGVPYRILVRGDRTINQHLNASPSTVTTLRAHGTIRTGDVAVSGLNTAVNGYTLIGNPYQSAVDMNAVLGASNGLSKQFYYVWDPTRNTRGAYVTVDAVANSNTTSGSAANRFAQPGQAFYVRTSGASPALTFRETYKNTTSVATQTVFRNAATAQIRFTLYEDGALAQDGTSADGFVINFNENNSNAIDESDALKPVNQDENIGVMNGGNVYSYESRNLPTASEVLPISHTQFRNTNYTYKIAVSGIENVNAYLLDKYKNTSTQLINGAETTVSFAIEAGQTASSAENRFDIVFGTTLGNEESAFAKAVSVYPNPVVDNQFFVQIPSSSEGTLTVKMANLLGQEVFAKTIDATENTVKIEPAKTLQSGIYMVSISNGKATTTKKLIVK